MRFIKWGVISLIAVMSLVCGACGIVVVVMGRDVYLSTGEDVISIENVPNNSARLVAHWLPRPNSDQIFIGPYPLLAAQIGPAMCPESRLSELNYGLATLEVWHYKCRLR
jgi:hypothetical protein